MKATRDNGEVCDLLFRKIPEPRNMEICKATNVYSNRYRIDIYTRNYDKITDLEKIKLDQSFFCSVNGDDLMFGTVYDRKIVWHENPTFVPPAKNINTTTHTFTTKDSDSGGSFSLRKK